MNEDGSRRDFALEVVRRLQRAGHQALWAGGCVRDLILGQTPADYDVATDATPEQVMAILPFRAVTVGISFGVVRVRHPHRSGASRSRSRLSGATVLMSMAGGPNRSYSARPSSTPPVAISPSTECFLIHSPGR